MKWRGLILSISAFVVFLFFYTVIGLAFVNRWVPPMQGEVGDKLYSSKQTNDIDYQNGARYEMRVSRQLSRAYPFLDTKYATVYIFEEGSADFGFGWSMDISSADEFGPMTATWTSEGVELTTDKGIRHFVPKKEFISGR